MLTKQRPQRGEAKRRGRPLLFVWAIGSVLLASIAARAQAGDYLVPPRSFLALTDDQAHYQANIRRWLLPGAAPLTLAQVVVLPSFEPEYSLTIERAGPTAYVLTYRLAQRSIWQAGGYKIPASLTLLTRQGTLAKLPARQPALASVLVSTRKVDLTPQVAQALLDVWSVALAQTQFPVSEPLYIDGTEFIFATAQPNIGYRSGILHAPPTTGSPMERLIQVVAGLRELATTPDHRDFRQDVLLTEAQQLLIQLAAH